jgi:LAO/AO transport system kinase
MAISLAEKRQLSRALSRVLEATVDDSLKRLAESPTGSARRVGITGPPGAGKSSLISQYAKRRLDHGMQTGILAIDPSSPISGGSLLGDRIRMEAVAGDPRLFIRSIPSRAANDGLCNNAADLLAILEGFNFDEIILETVGVGQAELGVRSLVDTLVIVLIPGAGDTIQAMKAGILECADIYVINKADLPGAEKSRAEIMSVLGHRQPDADGWRPKLVMTSALDGAGIDELAALIDAHQALLAANVDADQVRRRRRAYHLRSLIARRVEEVVATAPDTVFDRSLGFGYAAITNAIRAFE